MDMRSTIEATVRFAELVDGIVKLGAIVLVAYALVRLVPAMRQRGFTATIFGNEVKLNSPSEAVETLSSNFEKQIDDLRAQVEALQDGRRTERTVGPDRPPSSGPGVRTVLWVDDNPSNNLFEVGKLRDAGFVVTQVESTDAAVTDLQHSQFDLVITDMSRTEHGRRVDDAGMKLIEWIRRRESSDGRPQTPVFVYCSAWAAAEYGQAARDAGATGVTASTTELLKGIGEALPR
jgi:CheY-like chemotaxis protein